MSWELAKIDNMREISNCKLSGDKVYTYVHMIVCSKLE